MKKIVYICYIPLTDKVEQNFFIDALLQKHILVEYWDITELYFPGLHINGTIERDYIKKIVSFKALRHHLSSENLDDTLFIPIIIYEYRVLKLFRLLTRYKCRLGFFARYGIANTSGESITQRIVAAMKNPLLIIKYSKGLISRLAKKTGFVKEYDVVFAAGNSVIEHYAKKPQTEIVPVNYIDYDDYLLARNRDEKIIQEPYCVFLDQFLGLHPDDQIVGEKAIPDIAAYYDALNSLFDFLEQTYSVRVAIAAHPKAHYENNPFSHRSIYYHKTAILTRYAQCAIAHGSTSIIFAVVYKKPLLLVSMNDFRASLLKGMHNFARDLHVNIYGIDTEDLITKVALQPVNENAYRRYISTYLTSHTSEQTISKDIFVKYVLSSK